jgi:hypothetical protein
MPKKINILEVEVTPTEEKSIKVYDANGVVRDITNNIISITGTLELSPMIIHNAIRGLVGTDSTIVHLDFTPLSQEIKYQLSPDVIELLREWI